MQVANMESTAVKSSTVNDIEALLSQLLFFVEDEGKCFVAAVETAAPGGGQLGEGRQVRGNAFGPFIRLRLLCQSASVAFSPILETAQAVILTSGTLSPIPSTVAELVGHRKQDGGTWGGNLLLRSLVAPHFPTLQRNLLAQIFETGHSRKLTSVVSTSQSASKSSPEFVRLDTSYGRRDDDAAKLAVGLTLVEIIRRVPHGVLVFFPSYAAKAKLEDCWEGSSGVMEDIRSAKGGHVFSEASGMEGDSFDAMLSKFYTAAQSGQGAVLFGVGRGRASEGLNFANEYARAVVVVGIPYGPLRDVGSQLKRRWNDETLAESRRERGAGGPSLTAPGREGNPPSGALQGLPGSSRTDLGVRAQNVPPHHLGDSSFSEELVPPSSDSLLLLPPPPSGSLWYTIDAFRSLNQSIGRLLRHSADFGGIFLLDFRMKDERHYRLLPTWLREAIARSEAGLDKESDPSLPAECSSMPAKTSKDRPEDRFMKRLKQVADFFVDHRVDR